MSDVPDQESKEIEYKVPDWFLTHNVIIAAEPSQSNVKDGENQNDNTIAAEIPPALSAAQSNENCNSGDRISTTICGLDPQLYSEIRDITASALLYDRVSEQSYREQPSILLRIPQSDESQTDLLESLVAHIAAEVGGTLISVDLDDLHALSIDFVLQDSEDEIEIPSFPTSFEYFFGIGCKKHASQNDFQPNQRAMSAILDSSPKLKLTSRESLNRPSSEHKSLESPVFLLLHDVKRILVDIGRGGKIIKTLRTAVQERRNRGNPIIFFTTLFYDHSKPGMLDYREERVRKKILVDSTSVIDLPPLVPQGHVSTARARDSNLSKLKRILRRKLRPGFQSDILAPGGVEWDLAKLEPVSSVLEKSAWSDSTCERVARQIVGRTWDKSTLDLEDICEVIARLEPTGGFEIMEQSTDKSDTGLSANTPEETSAEASSVDEAAAEKQMNTKEKLEKIKGHLTYTEENLLPCVIDPDDLQITFDDVIVKEEVKDSIKQLLSLSNFRLTGASEILLKHIRITGALLYGPPGTGKTHLSRAIAKDSGATMLAISAADILSKRVGATEKFIQAMFSLATKLAPCVLFIDEADSLFRRRSSNDSEWVRSMINQFLLEMDGLGTKSDTPFVLIATNRPTDLDDAFLRRLPHKVFFPLPSEEDRVRILKTLVKEQDLHPLVSIEALAKATPGFSGSDLRSLCGHAALMFAIEQVKSHQTRLGDPLTARLLLENRHFAKALGNTHPSVSRWSVEKMEEFAARFNPQDFEPDDDSINLEQPLISDHWIHQLRDFVIEQS